MLLALAIVSCDIDLDLGSWVARVYSVDVGRNEDGEFKLIEINTRVAAFWRAFGAGVALFQERLAGVLLRAADSGSDGPN